MPLAVVVYLGLAGAVTGSFLDAFVWRWHTGRNFWWGRSQCEACQHRLGAGELVPVVSWVIQHGRCRHCATPIGPLSTGVEGALAGCFVASALWWPLGFGNRRAVATFVGIVTGWYDGLLALAVANGLALLVTLALVATGRSTLMARIAFGPYLVLGLVIAVLTL